MDRVDNQDENQPWQPYTPQAKPEWIYRPYGADDVMDVVKWWTGSFRRSRWAGTLPNNKFSEYMGEAIRQLLSRGSKCTLAVNPACPAQILGFVVTEKTRAGEDVVHYLFVKDYYRKRGISKGLLAEADVSSDGSAFYTHKTNFSKHYRGKFVPEIARRKEA